MRFVNVDDFKKEIMKCNADPINEFDLGWDTWGIFNAIDRTPTADVQPVIHAHWETTKLTSKWIFVCSHCHDGWYERYEDDNIIWKYCPDCGAKMDEEVEDDNTCL